MTKQLTQPRMAARMELNERFGYGYQCRMFMADADGGNGIESVLDSEPFTLAEATTGLQDALEEINAANGYNYQLHEVLCLDGEAVQANKRQDITSARIARDIREGKGELTHPAGEEDFIPQIIDGEKEFLCSGRGVVLICLSSWREDKMPRAKEALKRYCQYLAGRGYGGTAAKIWHELERKDKAQAASWVKATYGKYVQDGAALMQHVMGGV